MGESIEQLLPGIQKQLIYGIEPLLYRNEYKKDLGLYYSDESFRAFEVVVGARISTYPPRSIVC